MENIEKTPQEQLDYFVAHCWDGDGDYLFKVLHEYFIFHLSHDEMKNIIPQLLEHSKDYPQLVFLAENLFNRLTAEEQKSLDIYPVSWSNDDRFTVITKPEYEWRRSQGLPAKCIKGTQPQGLTFEQFVITGEDDTEAVFARPPSVIDFLCFEKVTSMMLLSDSENLTMA